MHQENQLPSTACRVKILTVGYESLLLPPHLSDAEVREFIRILDESTFVDSTYVNTALDSGVEYYQKPRPKVTLVSEVRRIWPSFSALQDHK